jgi:8-oxo-dGTP pyrophosphatase MutT (NUDIX family)
MASQKDIDAEKLRQRLTGTAPRDDPLDVDLPADSERWPAGMLENMTGSLKPAGVLIPVIDHAAELSILLTQRAADLKHHAGQVSFPGGRMEARDADITETALRETYEEIGIAAHEVSVIGYLQPMPTVTGYAVTPVVGLIAAGVELTIDRTEVDYAFEVPLRFLLEHSNRRLVERELHGKKVPMVEFHYAGERIWGATAYMLMRFLKILEK